MSAIPTLAVSSQKLYLADVPANLPKHLIWQSPLLLPEDKSDFAELDKRIRQAGMLWLKNNDIRPFNVLVLTHKPAWISYIFQRSLAPGQHPFTVGPIPRRMIREGISLPPYPLIFQEFTETISLARLHNLLC